MMVRNLRKLWVVIQFKQPPKALVRMLTSLRFVRTAQLGR
jgi:hypothetical protein